jgi:hypothetical protein
MILICGVTYAANPINLNSQAAVDTFGGGGGTITDIPTFGGGSGGAADTTTFGGGSSIDTTTFGGGSGGSADTTTFGGGAGNTGGSAGPGVQGPAIPKPTLSIEGIAGWIVSLMNYLVWAMMTAALLVFLYGIFKLMFYDGTKEESRSQGKKFMFWGIISLFVMVSVWGLVGVLKNSIFGGGALSGPQFKTSK